MSPVKLSQKAQKYLPIYLESLRMDAVPGFDLYKESGAEVVLYRAASQPFTERERQALLDNNVTRLLVDRENRSQYQTYLEANLDTIVMDTSIKESVRAGIVYDSAKMLMEDLFERPTLGENIQRSKELIGSTVGFVLTGQAAFHSLLEVMSFDYSTYTHSVNVCTLSLALAQYTGLNDPRDLRALGTGALLHDIGKTRVSDSILKKAGSLTDAEMDVVRHHPEWGCDIIKETDLVAPDSYYPILQHHERENESGYPKAVGGSRIHHYGKITAIADVFDAMTTKRVYRSAIDTYPALKEMYTDSGAFDIELLQQFTKMLGPVGMAD